MDSEKGTYILIGYSWQYGNQSGNGASTITVRDFNGLIGKKSLDHARESVIEQNPKIFNDKNNDSLNLFILSISVLGEMTQEEYENE